MPGKRLDVVWGFFPGLGWPELLVLLLGGLCFAGLVAGIVVLVVAQTRRQRRDGALDRQAALEAENQRLREELAGRPKQKDQS